MANSSETADKNPPESTLEDLSKAFNERDYDKLWALFDPTILEEVKSDYESYIKEPNYGRIHIDVLKTEQDEYEAKISAYETFDFSTEKSKSEYGTETCDYVEYELEKRNEKWIILKKEKPAPPFNAEEYDLVIELLPEKKIMIAQCHVGIKTCIENPKFIVMAINPGLRITKVSDNAGKELQFLQDNSMTRIDLENYYPENSTFSLNIDYAGGLFNSNEHYSQVNIGQEGSFASFVTFWYPKLIGHSKSDSPGTTGTITIKAPLGQKGFSNGRLIQEKTDERGYACKWKVDYPVDFSFALGDYTVFEKKFEGIPVVVYMLPHNAHLAEFYADEMVKILKIQKEAYGHFPFEKFGMVELPSDVTISLGGSSEQGFVFIPDRNNREFFDTYVYSHEMGHCWWGNFIKFKDDASFFTEALAQYSICLVLERLYGWDKMREWMDFGVWHYQSSARYYFYIFYKQKDLPYGKQTGLITPQQRRDMHSLSNYKGFWLFHILRGAIGDKPFFQALKKLAMGDYGRNLGIEEFKRAFKDSSDYDIDTFWAEWFERTGVPEYKLDYTIKSKNRKYEIDGTLEQIGDLYTTPVEIGIKTKGDIIIEKVYPKGLKTDFAFTVKSKPRELIVDPQDFILKLTDDGKLYYKLNQSDKLKDEKKYDEALECLSPYLSLMNDHPTFLRIYSSILIGKIKFKEAEKLLLKNLKKELEKEELSEKDQFHIQALRYYLGLIYDYEGKREKAIEQYKQILDIWGPKIYFTEQAEKGLKKPFKLDEKK
ncbi:hypothetical protein KKB18_13720 [bacterium]|nr:hypothetical protein [bacterium]